jgi:hypothetical protein
VKAKLWFQFWSHCSDSEVASRGRDVRVRPDPTTGAMSRQGVYPADMLRRLVRV